MMSVPLTAQQSVEPVNESDGGKKSQEKGAAEGTRQGRKRNSGTKPAAKKVGRKAANAGGAAAKQNPDQQF